MHFIKPPGWGSRTFSVPQNSELPAGTGNGMGTSVNPQHTVSTLVCVMLKNFRQLYFEFCVLFCFKCNNFRVTLCVQTSVKKAVTHVYSLEDS